MDAISTVSVDEFPVMVIPEPAVKFKVSVGLSATGSVPEGTLIVKKRFWAPPAAVLVIVKILPEMAVVIPVSRAADRDVASVLEFIQQYGEASIESVEIVEVEV